MHIKTTKKLLVTGATGLVGSRFVQLGKEKWPITTIGRQGVDVILDLLSLKEVTGFVSDFDAEVVINFAAYTKVDEAEKQRGDKSGEVYALNVLMPSYLARVCRDSGKKFYHISTDYVFSGKQGNRPYKETDHPSPVDSWYSLTKYEGELAVMDQFAARPAYSIIRISYPYSGVHEKKADFATTIISRLLRDRPYFGVTDQRIKPTSVDDIANAIFFLIDKNAQGIYHIAGDFSPQDYITPYEFAVRAAEVFNLEKEIIKRISFVDFSKGRIAPRPRHTWLSTEKIQSLGFTFTTFEESLKRFKNQFTTLGII